MSAKCQKIKHGNITNNIEYAHETERQFCRRLLNILLYKAKRT